MTPPIDEVLRDRGLKVTPQRLAVHRAVAASIGHPDAEEIWAAVRHELPTISLRTVYEVLHTLADLGEIRELDLATGSSRFDPTTSDHHHLVCTRCGEVADVFLDGPPAQVPPVQRQGFTLHRSEVTFRGLCGRCSTATDRSGNHQPAPSRPVRHRRRTQPPPGTARQETDRRV